MTEDKKPLKVVFAPGFFDNLPADLTAEDRAELVAQIERMAASGEMFELGEPLDPDDPEDAAAFEAIERAFSDGKPKQHQ